MKKILVLSFFGILATGCASSMQTAQQDCQKAGFTPGTPLFLTCINNQTKPTVFQQALMQRLANPGPSNDTVTCQPWLNGYRCTSF